MTDEQMFTICSANPTNRYICQHLDEKTLDLCIEMLLKLDANDFKEINSNADFDFSCLPIPYTSLENAQQNGHQPNFSSKVKKELDRLLKAINTTGTNLEYSYLLTGSKKNNEYTDYEPMKVGLSQTVEYDWQRIEDFIKKCDKDVKVSIFHTHPKPINQQHNTLYNKYKEILEKFGVKPDGLNLSLSDVYANQYLDMLCKKFGRDEITPESTVLMHDGTLISFSTKNGVELTDNHKLTLIEQDEEKLEPTY